MLGVRRYRGTQVDLYQGDLTRFATDAMVNAANAQLAGGSGVDGAIHRVGGPSIMEACRKIGGCMTGDAVVTPAGELPAKWVIHAVGPIWRGGTQGEAGLLAAAYQASLREADRLKVRHVSFPALSAGAYGYPANEAAAVALRAVKDYLDGARSDEPPTDGFARVTFVLFSGDHYQVFQDALFATFADLD